MDKNNHLTIRQKVVIYSIAFAFMGNLFIFFSLFIDIVFPNLRHSGVWSYIQLAIGLALFFAVAENLKKHTLGMFMLFNTLVAIVNVIAIWRHFYWH